MTHADNLSLIFQWYYYNTLIQAHTLDKAFRVQEHAEDLSMKKIKQRTGYGTKQVLQSE